MTFKNHLLFLCLIMVIFTIAGVSASDVNDTVIASEASNDIIAIDDAQNEDISASDEDAIADSPKTMTDLNNTISNSQDSTITLNDDYSYSADTDSSLVNGININKSITIDGQGHKINANKNMRIFHVTANVKVTFKDIIFLNGNIDDKNKESHGGAVWNTNGGNVTAINCRFENNHAYYDGGALYKVNAVGCTFTKNTVHRYGGAMYEGNAENCTFTDNEANHGGALYTANAVNCTFTHNIAGFGGAMRMGNATNCAFNNNEGTNGGALNGANAVNCIFTNNEGGGLGMGSAMYVGTAENCTFKSRFNNDEDIINTVTAVNCNFNNNNVKSSTIKFHIVNDNIVNLGDTVSFYGLPGCSLTVNATDENGITKTFNCKNNGWKVEGLDIGKYTVKFTINTYKSNKGELEIPISIKYNPELTVTVEDIFVGQNAIVNVSILNTLSGDVTVTIGGNNYTVNVNEGSGSRIISDLNAGSYTVVASFGGYNAFGPAKCTTKLEVKRYDLDLTFDVEDIYAGQNATVNVKTNNTFIGDITVTVNDKNYTVNVNEGSGSISIPISDSGNYTVTVSLEGNDKFNSDEKSATLEVKPATEMIDVVVPDADTPEFTISLPSDATGNLTVTINGENYTATLVNGSATITVPGLADGTYNATITYSGDDKYPAVTKNTTVTVKNTVYKISNNKDVTMLYTAKTPYKVLITRNGKAVAGVKVTFKFNGKTYTRTTDKNGYATLKLPNVKPKKTKYTVTATYNGITVKNNVKVNSIIKAKNKKVKKSKKVTKVKITLKKVNGKYLKAKTLKIKFKGKTYKVKTNKKGVAKWKVKKSMVKKLKAGKKYKYKVTYGKDTATKKLKIK